MTSNGGRPGPPLPDRGRSRIGCPACRIYRSGRTEGFESRPVRSTWFDLVSCGFVRRLRRPIGEETPGLTPDWLPTGRFLPDERDRSGRWASASTLVDTADPRAGPSRSLDDAVDVGEESLALLLAAEVGVGEAEHLHGVLLDGGQLDRAAADGVVLGEHDPLALASELEPDLVLDLLCLDLALDRRQRVGRVPGLLQRVRQEVSPQAAVDEELCWLRLRAGARHGSRLRRPQGASRSPWPRPSEARQPEIDRARRPSERRPR